MSKNFSGILECIKVYGPIGSVILLFGTALQIIFTELSFSSIYCSNMNEFSTNNS